jgi:DNA primase
MGFATVSVRRSQLITPKKGAHFMHPQDTPVPGPASRLTRTPEGLVYSGETLTYRITGLSPHNLDRLRVTLKAMLRHGSATDPGDQPTTFHIDTLDLYFSRGREGYAEACAKYLKAQQSTVMAELSLLIAALEAERVAMREKGNTAAVPPMSDEERKDVLDTLKSKDLLDRIAGDFDGIGYIGEKVNKLLAYIAAVSRLQADPLAVLVLSRSGAGKTSLQDAACKFVPPESVIQYTRLTGQSLFYRDQNALAKIIRCRNPFGREDRQVLG